MTPNPFKTKDRVQLHPATDLWMRGARYGTIERTGPRARYAYVRLDATGKLVRVPINNLLLVADVIMERIAREDEDTCDECGKLIPYNDQGQSEDNKHAESCSLYPDNDLPFCANCDAPFSPNESGSDRFCSEECASTDTDA